MTLNDGKDEYKADRELELLNQFEPLNKFAEDAYKNSINPIYERNNLEIPNGVEFHCAITSGLETVKKLNYKTDINSDVSIEYGDGDEEVPIDSLTFCQRWTKNITNLGKYNHQAMLTKKATIDYVKSLVCD